MELENMTEAQLVEELERLDAQRRTAKERGRVVMAALTARLAEDHAGHHGLTAENYAAMKVAAKADGLPLTAALARARRTARGLQVVGVHPANGGATGVR